jgi:hypothetical protein
MSIESLKHWFGVYNSTKVDDPHELRMCKHAMVNDPKADVAYRYFRIGHRFFYRDELQRFYEYDPEFIGQKNQKHQEWMAVGLVIALGYILLLR